jgi:hypothetical protein
MTSHSLETDYVSLCSSLQTRANVLMEKLPSLRGFWERWCKEHLRLVRMISQQEFNDERMNNAGFSWADVLKQRQRLVSALGQGLKVDCIETKEVRLNIKDLLREHDEGFLVLLNREMDSVREQMTKAFTVRKTLTAYAQTAQYRGE